MTPAEELALLGLQKHTPTILGRKFVFKSIDSDAEVMAEQTASVFNGDTRKSVLKIEKLARSIETIDGVPFSVSKEEEAKGMTPLSKTRELIYKWPKLVVDRVYAEYEEMEKLREKVIGEIEKNGQSPMLSSGAGK